MPAVTDESKNNKSAPPLLKLATSKLATATPLMPALVVSLPVAPISAGFRNVILESRANQLTSAGDGRENGAPIKTMNYELAKELKDAGFPQQQRAGTMLRKDSAPEDTDAYAPTLEELIEACPKRLTEEGAKDVHFSLTWQYVVVRGGDCWVAEYITDELAMGDTGFGDTPDEAVAQLWLVLKNKELGRQLR